MTKKITEHTTQVGSIMFMAAAKSLLNQKTGKSEYSLKIKLSESDPAVTHLSDIASYKVDTKTNRDNAGSGEIIINFASDFAPKVLGSDNTELEGREIPFFDGRKDKGTAVVAYKVIDYGDNKIVRLSGIKLIDLDLVPREDTGVSMDVTLDTLKNIG